MRWLDSEAPRSIGSPSSRPGGSTLLGSREIGATTGSGESGTSLGFRQFDDGDGDDGPPSLLGSYEMTRDEESSSRSGSDGSLLGGGDDRRTLFTDDGNEPFVSVGGSTAPGSASSPRSNKRRADENDLPDEPPAHQFQTISLDDDSVDSQSLSISTIDPLGAAAPSATAHSAATGGSAEPGSLADDMDSAHSWADEDEEDEGLFQQNDQHGGGGGTSVSLPINESARRGRVAAATTSASSGLFGGGGAEMAQPPLRSVNADDEDDDVSQIQQDHNEQQQMQLQMQHEQIQRGNPTHQQGQLGLSLGPSSEELEQESGP